MNETNRSPGKSGCSIAAAVETQVAEKVIASDPAFRELQLNHESIGWVGFEGTVPSKEVRDKLEATIIDHFGRMYLEGRIGCVEVAENRLAPPIKTLSPKEPFEWTRPEKKQFLEKLKTIKKGDTIENVVKVLGPPFGIQHYGPKKNRRNKRDQYRLLFVKD